MIEVQILFHKTLDPQMSFTELAKTVGTTVYYVKKILNLCDANGITFDTASNMEESELLRVLYPEEEKKSVYLIELDCEYWHRRYFSMSRQNMLVLWTQEYLSMCELHNLKALSYSQFCKRVNAWVKDNVTNIVMPIERKPGEKLFIDWVGDPLIFIMKRTKEETTAYLFLTVLGDSSYPFVEAFPDMKQMSWLKGHVDSVNFYGGLPRHLIPDNTKTAVICRECFDIKYNHAYLDLAYHYKVAIMPARVRHPKDKGSVESGVRFVEDWIMNRLQGKEFDGFSDLNKKILEYLEELSNKKFQKRAGTRREVFEKVDKPALRPLPANPFSFYETIRDQKVDSNYHVEFDGFYYSVPHEHADKKVSIRYDSMMVKIYLEGTGIIAAHERRYDDGKGGSHLVTDPSHMPKEHQAMKEFNDHDADYYRSAAKELGEPIAQVVEYFLTEGPLEDHGFRACNHILNLANTYGNVRVNAACRTALKLDLISVTNIDKLVKKKDTSSTSMDGKQAEKTSTEYGTEKHENLRNWDDQEP